MTPNEDLSFLKRWPKRVPVLSDEQRLIREDFMKHWHEILPSRYGAIERFNHGFPITNLSKSGPGLKTLELGAGLGSHIAYEENLVSSYTALELRFEMARTIPPKHPTTQVVVANSQIAIPFKDNSFDRVLCIHVLEHLSDLTTALAEINRILRPGGTFIAVIPCEGGALYSLCRMISARRIFERRYRSNYDWFIQSEHVNSAREILHALKLHFLTTDKHYFPLLAPYINCNIAIGISMTTKH